MLRKAKAWGINLLVLCISTVVTLGMVELGARLVYPSWESIWPQKFIEFDGVTGTSLGKPKFAGRLKDVFGEYDVQVKLDGSGFRNPAGALIPNADILVLGDSFAFGWGVELEDDFASVLSRNSHKSVYNLSVPGTDILDYLMIGRAMVGSATGKILIVAVTVENDIIAYPDPAALNTLKKATPARSPFSWFWSHSALFNVAAAYLKRSPVAVDLIRKAGILNNPQTINASGHQEALPATIRVLKEIRNSLAPARFIVLPVPPRYGFGMEADYTRFLEAAREHGFDIADLGVAFSREKGNHFPIDGHWTKKGHSEAGRLLGHMLSR